MNIHNPYIPSEDNYSNPLWIRRAIARRERAMTAVAKRMRAKIAQYERTSGHPPHKSMLAIVSMFYLEQELGHPVEVMMVGTAAYYEMARIIDATDIEEGSYDMSVEGHVFTLVHNPELPPFEIGIPLRGS